MQSEPGKELPLAELNSNAPWQHPLFHALLILVAGMLVYGSTITSPFIFDDYPYLVHNPVIKELGIFSDTSRILDLSINADIKHNMILRPVAYATFALNYALHGLDVRGYHLANLLIHSANGLLVYLLVRLLLRSGEMTSGRRDESSSAGQVPHLLPLFCALLFICHPLQTQAVTYIIQRITSLVTLFCLGSLVLYIHARLCTKLPPRIACYLLSLLAAILAMKTKENAFTLPVVITLCEFIFFGGSFAKRLAGLIPFLLTMTIIPLNLMQLSSLAAPTDADAIVDSIHLVNFRGVSSLDYLMTQFGVIVTYLRLLVLPIGQNFDHDYPLQKTFFSPAVISPLVMLLLILGAATLLLRMARDRQPAEQNLYRITAFGCFWFFITLAVESSIIPIDDLIFEHRVYLPSAGFFMSGLAGFTIAFARLTGRSLHTSGVALAVLCLVIVALSAASIARNRVWDDRITFWSDVAAKSPNKPRVHKYLGLALFDSGRKAAGTEEFRTAVRLNPGNVHTRIMLGKALLVQGQFDEAVSELLTAVRTDPASPLARVVLGEIYEDMGDFSLARETYRAAIEISPSFAIAHQRLGELYDHEGKIVDAIREYETSLQLYPDAVTRKRLAELKLLQAR